MDGGWQRDDNAKLWDYGRHNVSTLASLGIQHSTHVQIGYAPEMTRIADSAMQDIDVLFRT